MEIEFAESLALSKSLIAHLALNQPPKLSRSAHPDGPAGLIYSFTPFCSRLRDSDCQIGAELGIEGPLRKLVEAFGTPRCSCGGASARLSYRDVVASLAGDEKLTVVWAEEIRLPDQEFNLTELFGAERFIVGKRLVSPEHLRTSQSREHNHFAVRNSLTVEDALHSAAPPAEMRIFLFRSREEAALKMFPAGGSFLCLECGRELESEAKELGGAAAARLLSGSVRELLAWCEDACRLSGMENVAELIDLKSSLEDLHKLGGGSIILSSASKGLSTCEMMICGLAEAVRYSLSDLTFLLDHVLSVFRPERADKLKRSLLSLGEERGFSVKFLDTVENSSPPAASSVRSASIREAKLNVLRGSIGSGKTRGLSEQQNDSRFKRVVNSPITDLLLPCCATVAGYLGLDHEFASVFAATRQSRLQGLTPKHFVPSTANSCRSCAGTGLLVLDAFKTQVDPKSKVSLLASLERFAFRYSVCTTCAGAGLFVPLAEIEGVSYERLRTLALSDVQRLQWIPPALLAPLAYVETLHLGALTFNELMVRCNREQVSLLRLIKMLSTIKPNSPALCTFEHPSLFLGKDSAERVTKLFWEFCAKGHTIVCEDNTDRLLSGAEVLIEV